MAGGKSVWPMAPMQRNGCIELEPCAVGPEFLASDERRDTFPEHHF